MAEIMKARSFRATDSWWRTLKFMSQVTKIPISKMIREGAKKHAERLMADRVKGGK